VGVTPIPGSRALGLSKMRDPKALGVATIRTH